MTIKNAKEAYRTALVLAITAPNDKLAAECTAIAAGLEKTLTRREIKLIKRGIECANEYSRQLEGEEV
jgi:hypothetical protein